MPGLYFRVVICVFLLTIMSGQGEECGGIMQYEHCAWRQKCLYTNQPEKFCDDYQKHCCKLCQQMKENEVLYKNQKIGLYECLYEY